MPPTARLVWDEGCGSQGKGSTRVVGGARGQEKNKSGRWRLKGGDGAHELVLPDARGLLAAPGDQQRCTRPLAQQARSLISAGASAGGDTDAPASTRGRLSSAIS